MISKNLVVAVEKYTDNNGKERTKWLTIGQLHEHDGKQYITLDRTVNLSGIPPRRKDDGSMDYRVFANLFDPKSDRPNADNSGDNHEDTPF